MKSIYSKYVNIKQQVNFWSGDVTWLVCCASFSISDRLSSPVILAPVFKERETGVSRVEGTLGYVRDPVSNKGTQLVGDI